MKGCEHDKLFSGRTNLERRFEWICRRCGEMGWDERYDLNRVDQYEFYAQRVIHGWAGPRAPLRLYDSRLPKPPRMPSGVVPKARRVWPWILITAYFVFLAAVCLLAAIPWGALGPIMPLWMALVGAGLALLTAVAFYVIWKQGEARSG